MVLDFHNYRVKNRCMIKRTIFNAIEKHLKVPEMTVLIGPRQVGKTYLMKLLQKSLSANGEKTVFLNLDGESDIQLPYKFIISGSGSLDLKARIKESMTGRKQIFNIDPISFEEFVQYKTEYAYRDRLDDFFAIERAKTQSLLEE